MYVPSGVRVNDRHGMGHGYMRESTTRPHSGMGGKRLMKASEERPLNEAPKWLIEN